MKFHTLTSTLLASLTFVAFGQTDSELKSQIQIKEKELATIQTEIAQLRSKLNRPAGKTHTVRTGETVSSIARRNGVKASEIMKWNKITDPTKLAIGQKLVVAAQKATPSAPKTNIPTGTKSSYKIAKGDTFYSIARRHKLTVSQLRALNPQVSPNQIAAGQSITVTGKATLSKPRTAPPARIAKKTPSKTTTSTIKHVKTPAPAKKEVKTTTKVTKPTQKTESKPAATPKKNVAAASPKPRKTSSVVENKPVSTPPSPPEIEEKEAPAPSLNAVILTEETTFGEFAEKHNTSTTQLNALNGWNLKKATPLARGSEIYLPN